MSPLITILVIMLLTVVVYNESQFVTDYQDVFQKAFKKSAMPLECDSESQRNLCEISFLRQALENDINYIDNEPRSKDLMNYEIAKNVGQKRNNNYSNCQIVKTPVELGNGYFPQMLTNVSCLYSAGEHEGHRICQKGSNCQPIPHNARVLTRRKLRDTFHDDIPLELKACWKFEYIQIHVGCKCARS